MMIELVILLMCFFTEILLNAACTASQPVGQCADALAECASGLKCVCKSGYFEKKDGKCSKRRSPKGTCSSGDCVAHSTCDAGTSKCVCDAGYNPSPTISPTMCSGVVKVISLSYMYVVPILVFMMFLLR